MRRTLLIGLLLLCACNLIAQQATPTPNVPTVAFVFPDNNVQIAEGTDLQIQLAAQDALGIARVELRVDGTLYQEGKPVESAAVPVFTVDMNWLAEGVGLHAFEAVAYRLDGTASSQALINVQVTPAS
jgi:Bacterial Ig domain